MEQICVSVQIFFFTRACKEQVKCGSNTSFMHVRLCMFGMLTSTFTCWKPCGPYEELGRRQQLRAESVYVSQPRLQGPSYLCRSQSTLPTFALLLTGRINILQNELETKERATTERKYYYARTDKAAKNVSDRSIRCRKDFKLFKSV